MTHLWWSRHSSPKPPFLPFSSELQKCFSSVGAALLAWLHGAGVPSGHVPPAHPNGELPARLLGCSVHAQFPADGVTSSGFSDAALNFDRELKARPDQREIPVLLDPREQR